MSYSSSQKWSWNQGRKLGFARGASFSSSKALDSYLERQATSIITKLLSSASFEKILTSPSFIMQLSQIVWNVFNSVTLPYIQEHLPEGQVGMVGRMEFVSSSEFQKRVDAGWDPNNLKTQMRESEWWRVPNLPDPRPGKDSGPGNGKDSGPPVYDAPEPMSREDIEAFAESVSEREMEFVRDEPYRYSYIPRSQIR